MCLQAQYYCTIGCTPCCLQNENCLPVIGKVFRGATHAVTTYTGPSTHRQLGYPVARIHTETNRQNVFNNQETDSN